MLALESTATLQQVEARYNEEAQRLHPSHHGGNPQRLKQLDEATATLRSRYAEKPRERNSGESFRRHGRKMRQKFGEKFRRCSFEGT